MTHYHGPSEIWTWPFTDDQQAALTNVRASTDGMQDVYFYGPDAATCLGYHLPDTMANFADSEPGDSWVIRFARMTDEDIAALPEFVGF